MGIWHSLRLGVRGLVRGRQRDGEVADEVAQYFEQAEQALRERGMSDEQARRAARVEMGTPAAARDQARAFGWEHGVEVLLRELRTAARQLRRQPLFTAAAMLTLMLGIGANTAVFSVVESVLLAPLPYPDASRICVLQTYFSHLGRSSQRVTGPDGSDLRAESGDFAAISLYNGGSEGVQLQDHAVYTVVTWADENFARVFGLKPVAGRLLRDADAHHAALVGERFARMNFGSAQAALGQTLHVENEAITIAGVLPDGFDFPAKTEVWEAASLHPESVSRTAFNYKAVGLLRAGVSLPVAQAELRGISQRLQNEYPAENRNKWLVARPLREAMTGDARPTLLLLWAMAGLLLVVACVNVAHLELVQSAKRERELAIRKALGATRWQVARPVLMESLLLALLGGGAGVALAYPMVRVLLARAPGELPRAAEIHLNGWVLLFTLCVAVVTAVAAALLPAMRAMRVDPAEVLKRDAARGLERREGAKVRDALVVAEVTATFVLLVGSGLLLHTMAQLLRRNLGYEARSLLVVDVDAPAHTAEDAQRVVREMDESMTQLKALPGVEHVAGVMGLPMGAYGSNGYYEPRGGLPVDPLHMPYANWSVASPGYFATMAIPMLRGREFDANDGFASPFVAIISQSLARQSFGDVDPVGKQIRCGLDSDKWMTVVGVVGDVRQDSPAETPGPTLYMPMAQHPYYANQIHLVLRTSVPPLMLMHPAERTILGTQPMVAMRFTTMDAMVEKSLAVERFRAQLIASFAAVGLMLAMLGVYGTMAYAVAQRRFEIGLRIAFGARRETVLRMVLEHAAALAGGGIVVGLALSLMMGRILRTMLVDVKPSDGLSLAGAAGLLLLTALCAAWMPAWQAMRVDPVKALRAD